MDSNYEYMPQADFFIERVEHESGFEMPNFHIHYKYEIYYELEGTRRYFIEDGSYIVNAGSVVLIGENQIHKTASVGDGPSARIVLNFSAEYLRALAECFPEVDFFSFLGEEQNHLLSGISVRQQNHIQSILQQLLDLQGSTAPESEALRRLLLATLLELKQLCIRQQAQGDRRGRISNRIVDQVQAYIAQHYAEKLTLTGIAGQFYISPYYLSRLFKKSINISLVEYINGVRIKAAQSLIEKTDDSIGSVAEQAGFMTTAHFRRVFKEATGLSPQQYRRHYRRINRG